MKDFLGTLNHGIRKASLLSRGTIFITIAIFVLSMVILSFIYITIWNAHFSQVPSPISWVTANPENIALCAGDSAPQELIIVVSGKYDSPIRLDAYVSWRRANNNQAVIELANSELGQKLQDTYDGIIIGDAVIWSNGPISQFINPSAFISESGERAVNGILIDQDAILQVPESLEPGLYIRQLGIVASGGRFVNAVRETNVEVLPPSECK